MVYLNAKYADELGTLDLYPCVILADHENDGPWFPNEGDRYLAQREDDARHVVRSIAHALDRGRTVRDTRFTPERWAAFSHDLLVLQREARPRMSAAMWRELIRDHGYNGTPVWTTIAAPLAAAVPVEAVKLLGGLDVALIVAATALVAWAYGRDVAGWALFWMTVTFSMRWPVVSWVFLRYDHLFALVAALCLLRRGRPGLAGVFAGTAAALRVFPTVWCWGMAVKAPDRRVWRFIAGFVLAVVLLQGTALARWGVDETVTYSRNMLDQQTPAQLPTRSAGLAIGLTWDGAREPLELDPARRAAIGDQGPVRLGLAAVWLVAVGWAVRRRPDDEAFGYGFLPFFLLTTAEYYYYATRLTLVVVHAADLDRPRNRAGLAVLLLIEVCSTWARARWPASSSLLVGSLSWGLLAYTLGIGAWLLADARRER